MFVCWWNQLQTYKLIIYFKLKYLISNLIKHVQKGLQNQRLQFKFKYFPVFCLHDLKSLLVLRNSCTDMYLFLDS